VISGSQAGVAIDAVGVGPPTIQLRRLTVINNAVGIDGGGLNVEVRDSVIASNGRGISGNSKVVVNNIIVGNGSASAGVGVSMIGAGGVIAFNTIANNASDDAARSGAACAQAIEFRNNIVSGNGVTGCVVEFSLLFNTNLIPTGSNVGGDPRFRNASLVNPFAADFFRIQATSPAIDVADPSSGERTDIDGDARPQGVARDMGADEFKP
jgi:hypothetical protein